MTIRLSVNESAAPSFNGRETEVEMGVRLSQKEGTEKRDFVENCDTEGVRRRHMYPHNH